MGQPKIHKPKQDATGLPPKGSTATRTATPTARLTGTLICGETIGRGPNYLALRPDGTRDWLAIYTIAGRGRFTHADGETILGKGDLFIVHPGTPQDYGTEPQLRRWHNIWSHFVPRDDALSWLQWPQIYPGVMRLAVRRDLQPTVLKQFREAERFSGRAMHKGQELALNALERALLIADACNPLSRSARYDHRVREAIELILNHLSDPLALSALAEMVGLSRSRFSLLFARQTGQTPGAFIEQHRLFRAKRLLEGPHRTLQEISDELGFSSPFYLSLRFKRWLGCSPREYRRAAQGRRN